MEKAKIKRYLNGAEIKFKNKKVVVAQTAKKDSVIIQFRFADTDANTPACEHHCFRGKVRQTTVKLSEAGIEALAIAIIEYKRIQKINKLKEQEKNEKRNTGE